MFVKFRSGYERDWAVGTLKSARLKNGDKNVWATQDLPVPTKAGRLFLMGLRWQLGELGSIEKEREIDDLYTHCSAGGKMVLKVSAEEGYFILQRNDAWAARNDLQQRPKLQAIADKSKRIFDNQGKGAGKGKAARGVWMGTMDGDNVPHSRVPLVRQPVLRKVSRHLHAPRI